MRLLGLAAGLLPMAVIAAPPGVTVDRATQARLGLMSAPLQAVTIRPGLTSFAHVLDPTPLMTIDSDIEAAAAAAAASSAEARRARALAAADATIARKTAEAAAAQARGDAAKLLLLRRRLTLEWGGAIGALSARQRSALVAGLASGHTALLRIDTPAGAGFGAVRSAMIEAGDGRSAPARFLGDARAADPRQAIAGKLAIVEGPAAGRMAIGLTLPVRLLAGTAASGVFVPASAILRHAGRSWVYRRRSGTGFDRIPLAGTAPQAGGLLVRQNLSPGDVIVTRGAAQLYTAEQASHAAGE